MPDPKLLQKISNCSSSKSSQTWHLYQDRVWERLLRAFRQHRADADGDTSTGHRARKFSLVADLPAAWLTPSEPSTEQWGRVDGKCVA